MKIPKFQSLLFGFVIIFFSLALRAASVLPMALDQLVADADTIVVARCTDIRSYWKDDKIYTDNVLEIDLVIKGEHASQHVVTTLGGTAMHPRLKAPVEMSVPGGTRFVLNEEVLIFTSENSEGIHQIVGFTQGKLAIETDVLTGRKLIPIGQKVVTSQPDEAASFDQLFSPAIFSDNHQTKIRVRKMELSEMISRIQTELERP